MTHRSPLAALAVVLLSCGASAPQGPAQKSPTPGNTAGVVMAETFAKGLEHPWGMAFLPDGRAIVTERPGRVRLVAKDGKLSEPLRGAPAVLAEGQGGMLDVALDPEFAKNHRIYLSYAEPGVNSEAGLAGTAVASFTLTDSALLDYKVIYQQQPKVNGAAHFGSRLVFGRDGKLFITQGDRFLFRDRAQMLDMGMGKVMRINSDGSIPTDNPFIGRAGALQAIWSYGHRNMQGAFLHPETGELWTIEHGPRGGDELNRTLAGKNYGWPVITYGIDYNGSSIGIGAVKDGMEQPVYYWNPVIAASGLLIYMGDRFPEWKGNFFVGSMTPGGLVRLEMKDGKVAKETRYLGELQERIRNVVQGPDGYLYLLTDSGMGRILKVVPATH